MPVDVGTRGRDPAPPRKPPPSPVRPDDRAVRPGPTAAPAPVRPDDRPDRAVPPASMPDGPPVAALQKHGTSLSVTQLNDRVHNIVTAHTTRFGVKPSPGLVFDLVRSPTDVDYDRLFDLPRTKRQARDRAALASSPGLDTRPDEGTRGPNDDPFLYGQPDEADLETARNFPNLPRSEQIAFLRSISDRSIVEKQKLLQAAGRLPMPEGRSQVVLQSGTGAEVVAGFVLKGGLQLFGGLLLGPPTLIYGEGAAVKHSVEQKSLKPLAETNVELGKAVVEGVKEDVTHPWGNPGFLALDILGFASLGAGAAARVSAATRATGVVAKTRALATRPAPGTSTIKVGDLEVHPLLSENAAVRPVQRAVRAVRQRKMNQRRGEELPADAVAFTETSYGKFWQEHFSFERKVGRELAREDKLTVQLRDSIRKDLDRATGWAGHVSTVQSKLPKRARRGLTRGEQMALMIESLDDATPARTLRRFHEQLAFQGVGDTAAHVQKLRDIAMAEKVLSNPAKQSPRFQKALALTREAVAEMEYIKINELGLDARTAATRVALPGEVIRNLQPLAEVGPLQREVTRLENEIARTGSANLGTLPDQLDAAIIKRDAAVQARDVPQQFDESFYVPTVTPLRTKKLAKNPFRGVRFGQFGASRKLARELVPELGHEFTGKALVSGDYRIDTTRLVGEAVGRTVRGALVLEQYRKHLAAATKTPRTEFDRPIRTPEQATIPDDLRAIFNKTDAGELTAEEAGHLSKADWDGLVKELYPGVKNERTGQWTPTKPSEGVMWVDERILDPQAFRQPLPTAITKALQAMNAPFRAITLYARPAYLVNLAGSATMAAIFEGALAPPNVLRALLAKTFYSEKNANWLRDLIGGGRTVSYVDEQLTSRATKRVAAGWNRITDQDLRVSALIYYLRREGVKSDADLTRIREASKAGDKEAFRTLNEALARAKKGSVEFDNLTWVEQNLLRHVIFVYPWQRGAAVWSIRTLIERPVKSAVLAQIGHNAEDDLDEFLSKAPDWFKRAGFLPLRWDDDGNPTIVNPSGLNTWSGLATLMHGDPEDFGGPATEFAARGFTGRDEFGNEYPDDNWARWGWAALDVTAQLPQIRALMKRGKNDEALPPINPADRETLVKRRNAALKQVVLQPAWLWGFGGLVTGGPFTPREANRLALEARYYADAPYDVKIKANRSLVMDGLKLQGGLLGMPVPRQVTRLVGIHFDTDVAIHDAEQEKGRDLTPAERTLTVIDYYKKRGFVTDTEAAKLTADSAKLLTDDEHSKFRTAMFQDYLDPTGNLRRWDSDVRQVAALSNPKILQRQVDNLAVDGLLNTTRTVKASHADLLTYAQKVVAYSHEREARMRELSQVADPDRKTVAYAAFREWAEAQDKPIRVGNVSLPSPARVDWAQMDTEGRADLRAAKAALPWEFLASFDKEIVGRKPDPDAAKGWATLAGYIAEYKANLPPGERRLPKDYEAVLARHVDKYVAPGFFRDWQFSKEVLATRLQVLRTNQSTEFKSVVAAAVQYAAYLKNDDYSKQAIKDTWHDYVKSTVEPYVAAHPQMEAEIDRYGADIFYRMLD